MMRLLTRFVTGEATGAERAEVETWMANSPSRERLIRDLTVAGATPEQSSSRYDPARAWRRVARSTGILEEGDAGARPISGDKAPIELDAAAPRRRRIFQRSFAGLAAAAVLLLVVPAALYLTRGSVVPSDGSLIFATTTGEVREIGLPDGSQVTLGPQSSLRYLRQEDGTREVELAGRAFFDVAHEAERPFLVRAHGTTTRVLGTRFAIRAYEDEYNVRVVVEEGQVGLESVRPGGTDAVVLGPGDVAEVGDSFEPVLTRGAKSESELDWAAGLLSFDQMPLPLVLIELEHWYEARIEIGDPELMSRRLSVTLHRGALEEVLEPIALTLDARIERRGDTFVLLPRTPASTTGTVIDEGND